MFKISYLAVFFTLFTLQSFAQNQQIGIRANLTCNRLVNNSPLTIFTPTGNFQFSGGLGFWREQHIKKHSYWGLEFLWAPVVYKTKYERPVIELDAQGNLVQTGYLTDKTRTNTSYMAIPAYYLYRPGKWGLKAGVQFMIPLFSFSKTKVNGTYQNQPYNRERLTRELILNYLDIGPKIGIDYGLNSRFRLTADYYHGLASLQQGNSLLIYNVRQFGLGLDYIL